MLVSRQQVVDFIRERGDKDRAADAEERLPEQLDLPDQELLVLEYGVHPRDLAGDVPDHGGATPGTESGEAAADDHDDHDDHDAAADDRR